MMNFKELVPNLPDNAPDIGEVLLDTDKIDWREKSLIGLYEKMLWRAENDQGSIALIRFDKGVGIPAPHSHASNQFMFVLQGHYEYTSTGVTLKAGSFYWNPKGHIHGPTIAHEETIVLEIYDGPHYPERPSWYTDDEDTR
jgi:2,4'-dihydroxyacetophenone dioxygenase